jgi:hypothetical protein
MLFVYIVAYDIITTNPVGRGKSEIESEEI